MTALETHAPDDQKRLEEAAGWRLRLTRDPSLESSTDYLAWIGDLDNARALRAVDAGWSAAGAVRHAPEVMEMRRQALARVRAAGESRRGTRSPWVRIAAGLVIMVILAGGLTQLLINQPITYVTEIGERRVVPLPDGSHISMDGDSKVLVSYSKTQRALTLSRGRARFDVAHDTERPFTVTAGAETVVAVGTSFDVEKLGDTVLVTLIQGQVVVKNEQAATSHTLAKPKSSVSLTAGQQLVADHNEQPAVSSADLQVAAAWEAGHLVFRDEPLDQVVARINRYAGHPVQIDPAVSQIRISGVFNAGDISSFVNALTAYEPVQASTTASGGILLQPKL
jgi:transmembrane sensor